MAGEGARLIHVWHRCHGCGMEPIVGRRYDCRTCPAGPDNHLCESCHAAFKRDDLAHPIETGFLSPPTGPHVFVAAAGAPPEDYERWRAVPDASIAPLRIPDRFVVRPEFCTDRTSYLGSYAFVVDAGGSTLIVTALHVLDEVIKNAGLDCSPSCESYSGEELPRLVRSVVLYDVFAARWMLAKVGTAVSMLTLPDARVGEDEPYCQRDMAAFIAGGASPLTAVPIAAVSPRVGEPVWLAANPGPHRQGRTIAAIVVERTARSLIFRFDRAADTARSTSGAPLINARGDIVGINVGGGCLDGRRYGHAVHVESMRRHLGLAVTTPGGGLEAG